MAGEAVRMLLVAADATEAELALRALARHEVAPHVKVMRDDEAALQFLFATADADRATLAALRVVVLDSRLPRGGGLEVLQRIKSDERTRCIPVVVLTSSREDRDVADCYSWGANSYVVKPADPAALERAVEQMASYWLTLNQPVT